MSPATGPDAAIRYLCRRNALHKLMVPVPVIHRCPHFAEALRARHRATAERSRRRYMAAWSLLPFHAFSFHR